MAYSTTLQALTDDEAAECAAIIAILAALGAYGGALPWHDGERHADDDPPLLADEVPGWLLSLPRNELKTPHLSQ